MCGIIGGIHPGISRAQAAAMLAAIAHRGPDDNGLIMAEDGVFLGAVRLSIQDLSDLGHQPMQSRDGRYTIVFNGEIYNHKILRIALSQKGIQFRSGCDTETLLQAYIAYGADCLPMLQGMFAFAVFDSVAGELFIARDAIGIKPLYCYDDGKNLLFASELKALLRLPFIDYSILPEVFFQYLILLYSPDEKTPFRHIRKLLPGHFIRRKTGASGAVTQAWYNIPAFKNLPEKLTAHEWTERVETALKKSVQSQLISDAPVGAFLSGGLDSGLVAAFAKPNNPEKLQCFTIATSPLMQAEGFSADLPYAKLAAKHLGVPLTIVPDATDIAGEFDQMIWQLDEPQADPAALHVLHISAAARAQGIKVLLSGAGADDVFSGYRRHQVAAYIPHIPALPAALEKSITQFLKMAGKSGAARRLEKLFAYSEYSSGQQQIALHFWKQPAEISALFQADIRAQFSARQAWEPFEKLLAQIPQEQHSLNQMLYLEMSTFLPHHNLNYTDKMSMAAGIETRVPYLDTDLIALAASLPTAMKMTRGTTKYILRKIAANYLPQAIITRSKTGFGSPLRHWIKHELAITIKERLLDDSFLRWNIFSRQQIENLIADNASGKTDGAYTLFSLLAIESWLRQFAA